MTEAQAARLRRLARRRKTSMAALIRDAVDRVYSEPGPADDPWDRAIAAIGGFRSGRRDGSENHDDAFADALGE